MARKKEKQHSIILGDVVTVQQCTEFGMLHNTYHGVLIWRPMSRDTSIPQVYAIWTWNKLSAYEAEINKQYLHEALFQLQLTSWESRIWTYMMSDENIRNILYVPRNYKDNIQFVRSEDPIVKPGDLVVDKRWLYRFYSGNARRVLAVKKDEGYNEDRLCIENTQQTRWLGFYNWVSTVLRRNVIKISKETTIEIKKEPRKKQNRLTGILTKSSQHQMSKGA